MFQRVSYFVRIAKYSQNKIIGNLLMSTTIMQNSCFFYALNLVQKLELSLYIQNFKYINTIILTILIQVIIISKY